jgi:hypothetical protein
MTSIEPIDTRDDALYGAIQSGTSTSTLIIGNSSQMMRSSKVSGCKYQENTCRKIVAMCNFRKYLFQAGGTGYFLVVVAQAQPPSVIGLYLCYQTGMFLG